MSTMPMSDKTTKGPDHAVPCPHCGFPNDFREIDHVVNAAASAAIVNGQLVECDQCQKNMEVVDTRRMLVIVVRQAP